MHEKFIWADNNLEITHESNISYYALPMMLSHAITFCGLMKEVKDDHYEETIPVLFSTAEHETWYSSLKQQRNRTGLTLKGN